MQHYLHIGGDKDSLSIPATDDAESVQWQLGLTDKELYRRSTLSVGDASIVVFIHESLTPQQALYRLIESYKAWAIHQPGVVTEAFRGAPAFSTMGRFGTYPTPE